MLGQGLRFRCCRLGLGGFGDVKVLEASFQFSIRLLQCYLGVQGLQASSMQRILLGGSWYLLTNCNCAYNCTYDHIRALKGLVSGL